MAEPKQGMTCPGCGQPPVLASDVQAVCGSDDCHVLMWNPNKTLTELAGNAQHVNLGGDR